MDPTRYTLVAEFIDDGEQEMPVVLEMTCEGMIRCLRSLAIAGVWFPLAMLAFW
jgi:hypothetical protein